MRLSNEMRMGFLPDSQADIDLETSVGFARQGFKIQIRYWNAARELGCHMVFSEDLNCGQD